MYGIINSENGETCEKIVSACDQILKELDLDMCLVKYSLLKDGSPSFIQPAINNGLCELACTAHMGRPEGVGRNSRGSLPLYMKQKKISDVGCQQIMTIFWAMNHITTHKEYDTAYYLFCRFLLTEFEEERTEETSGVKCFPKSSTPKECATYLHIKYGALINRAREKALANEEFLINDSNKEAVEVIIDPQSDIQPRTSIQQCTNFEKTIIHLLEFYFPRNPTYGPAFSPGDPRTTNALEKNWDITQKLIKEHVLHTSRPVFYSCINMVQQQTSIPSCFQTSPVPLKADFETIERYVSKNGDIPVALKFAIFYDYKSTEILFKNNFVKKINSCVVYFPTPWFLDLCLRVAYEAHCDHQSFGSTIQYHREIPNNAKSQLSWVLANMKEMRTVIQNRLHGKFKTLIRLLVLNIY